MTMLDADQPQQPMPPAAPKKTSLLTKLLWAIGVVLLGLCIAIAVMVSTDKGSRFLLDRVLSTQSLIEYQYESGNIVQGIILKQVKVNLTDLSISADRADVALGWRAILNKEIHLSRADLSNLKIHNTAPPSDEPFKYAPIELPFVLRIDHAQLDQLAIQSGESAPFIMKDIDIKDVLWKGTELNFVDGQLDLDFLTVKGATGSMHFNDKYPIHAKAIVNIPALNDSLNLHDLNVAVRGSLDQLKIGTATYTPDLLTAWALVSPLRPNVPMQGELILKNYKWPLLTEQELYSEDGRVKFQGDIEKLNLALNTDLSAADIPKGQYTANLNTDLVNQLNIEKFDGQLLGGNINLAGLVSWKDDVHWDIKGRLDRLNPKDEIIPQVVRDFLPESIDAAIQSKGALKDGMQVDATVDFDRFETWGLSLKQAATPVTAQSKETLKESNKQNSKETLEVSHKDSGQPTAAPMYMDVSWTGIDRAMPYIGWLNSRSGQVNLVLKDNQQDIDLKTTVASHENGTLPAGDYVAKIQLKDQNLIVPSFSLSHGASVLTGQAKVELPDEKRQLKWQAQLDAKNFNPQSVSAEAPVNLINGQVKAHGYALPNQQIIEVDHVDLIGQMAGQAQAETVHLKGKSTAALLFQPEKEGGGFKSYAVLYDGSLNASQLQQGDGRLKIKVAGTTDHVKINQFEHDGVAGRILANGMLNFKQGLTWDISSSLIRFKPQYFASSVRGEISGNVKSQGHWSESNKRISIQDLNLAGTINQKVLRGQGNLSLVMNNNEKGLLPQQFEANNLFLSYANNRIQATGNAQNLALKVDAPALNQIYAGMRGRAYGYLNLKAQPRLSASANLIVDDFRLNDIRVKKLSLIGEVPTSDQVPSSIKAQLDSLRMGGREIQYAAATLTGTHKSHLLQLQGWNYYSKFYVQFAGGFNANNDWLGQIQKGEFDSVRSHLFQNNNAAIIFNQAKSTLYVGEHCWASKESKLCFDQPINVSAKRGNVSFVTSNLDLKDFEAFMPEGFAMTGKVNGYAKAAWAENSKPKIDAKLITRDGVIGLAAADPDDAASTLNYDEASVIAKSVQDKLLLRVDLKTPEIGTGFASVLINPYSEAKNMQGEVAFNNVQLKMLKPFIADVRKMDGQLSLAGKINGTLSQPLFDGEMRLKNGSIEMMSVPVNLTNIQLYSSIRRNNASLKGAFNSGSGIGKLDGEIDWRDDPRIILNLKGDKLILRQAQMVTAQVNTDIHLEAYPMRKRIVVNGDVDIPRALINMPESSPSTVNVSPDVRIVRQGDDQLLLLKAAQPWDVRADLNVNLGSQVIFQGFDSRIPLIGRLKLTQRGLDTAMRATGAIGVSRQVKIEAYGQSLDLTRAIARFNGPLSNPTLDVETRKAISGSTLGIRVTGTASSPNIIIYNDAGLSEQEALNALLTGRINEGSSGLSSTEGFKSDVNNTIAAAGISLGLGGTRAFTNQIGRNLGLSGLALDAQGTGDDTQVSLTGYITPDLFIRYGVGVFTPVNKLTMRYQVNKRLYLEASESVEKAIDLFYNWRF